MLQKCSQLNFRCVFSENIILFSDKALFPYIIFAGKDEYMRILCKFAHVYLAFLLSLYIVIAKNYLW